MTVDEDIDNNGNNTKSNTDYSEVARGDKNIVRLLQEQC